MEQSAAQTPSCILLILALVLALAVSRRCRESDRLAAFFTVLGDMLALLALDQSSPVQ